MLADSENVRGCYEGTIIRPDGAHRSPQLLGYPLEMSSRRRDITETAIICVIQFISRRLNVRSEQPRLIPIETGF